jgi:tyrosyl-tRNA synthetase
MRRDEMADVIEELSWRNMIHHAPNGQPGHSEGLPELLASQHLTLYCGFDPTGDSLHVGSLMPIMTLVHFQRHGHLPIGIVGGATGLIGDPSGKSSERTLLTTEEVEANLVGIRKQLERFLDFDRKTNPARIIDNADWLSPMPTLDFLRIYGKHFTVNYMLAKESVEKRMNQAEGMSFTEFAYLVLQSIDFLVLHDRWGCRLQVGGSDQWGNITAGIDLIRRLRGVQAHGLVMPLVTTADGTKFGKTETGTIWLDPRRTSPFAFYQSWMNTADADVVRYLKFFTLLRQAEIAELEEALMNHPERRSAQRRLADEVTRMVHGEGEVTKAQRAARVLFGEVIDNLTAHEVLQIFSDVPSTTISETRFEGEGMEVIDLVVACRLTPSRGEARRLVQGGGIYVNNVRVSDPHQAVHIGQSINGQVYMLRRGAKEYHLVRIAG